MRNAFNEKILSPRLIFLSKNTTDRAFPKTFGNFLSKSIELPIWGLLWNFLE